MRRWCRLACSISSRSNISTVSFRHFTSPGFGGSSTKQFVPTKLPLTRDSGLGARLTSTQVKQHDSTIYALSTAPGRGAIAIIRISGRACLKVHQRLCPDKPSPKPRHATLRTLYDTVRTQSGAQVLDSGALVLYFPAPETATGEDVLELHVHGGTAVVKAVLAAIPKCVPENGTDIIRYAEPGEFTRRAFYNNRLDLIQIEALGDTLAADTEQQRRLAVRGSTGVRAERYEEWGQKLLYARGELEALIDFSEDQQFDESPAKLCASVVKQVQQLTTQLKANIESAARGELLRNGINIALIGAPNAGKSSLLNQVVGREAAIVSSEAGTTRDVIDVNVDIGGYFCRFGDLAGLRKPSGSFGGQEIGEIEWEGMRRAKHRALSADVVIAVLSAQRNEGSSADETTVDVDTEVLETLKQCNPQSQKIVFALNKADLFSEEFSLHERLAMLKNDSRLVDAVQHAEPPFFAISCTRAQATDLGASDPGGIQTLLQGLTTIFGEMTGISSINEDKNSLWAESLGATERQRVLLEQCLRNLEDFLMEMQPVLLTVDRVDETGDDIDVVLAAESLRSAADCLARVTGKGEAGDVEEVLGVVFEKFCVGK